MPNPVQNEQRRKQDESLKLKSSEAVLNIEVTNHIFDSLKIGKGDERIVRIRTSDMIVF
ncbi:MAG: hypothetical protein RBR63_09055 [Methanosarcina vacuolata]|jgi:molybdate transport system ATP-binding protein|nr:hypothetical protein [Methanosarcina vacuolata]